MKKKDKKVLEEIQLKVNAKYGDKLFKMQPKADVLLEVIDLSLTKERGRFKKEELDRLQAIKDSHMLVGEEKVVDEKVVKQMDKYSHSLIKKAISEGRLTHPEKDPFIKKLKQMQNRHGKRTTKS